MTTMMVVLVTSCRVGQETFFISSTTSCQKLRILFRKPEGLDNKLSFSSSFRSSINAAPSCVRDAAIFSTSTFLPILPSRAQVQAQKLAGVSGFEPELSVLETDVLTVNTIPLQTNLIQPLHVLLGLT